MSTVTASPDPPGAIYRGEVVHRRVRPRQHKLRYSVFSLLVDLDRLAELDASCRLLSVNRFNVFAFHESDFGPRDGTPLAIWARDRALQAGVITPVARIRMLAYPRIFGYAFNPIAVYFLENAEGRVVMTLYEVHNTFGEKHFYDVPVDGSQAQLRHHVAKAFYVSPFNTLEGVYRFTVRPPADRVFTGIVLETAEGPLVSAQFDGERAPLSDATLFNVMLAYPFMTVKVMIGIHWEALLLWLKGVPLTLRFRRGLRDGRAARR